jgi:hypothetical protein
MDLPGDSPGKAWKDYLTTLSHDLNGCKGTTVY